LLRDDFMAVDYAIEDHKLWLGYLQPDGLVVSPAAMVDAQILVNRNTLPLQQRFLPFVSDVELETGKSAKAIMDFGAFATGFLEWPTECVFGLGPDRPVPIDLSVTLIDYGETLSPDLAILDPRGLSSVGVEGARPRDAGGPRGGPGASSSSGRLMLVKVVPVGTDLDKKPTGDAAGWAASESQRLERLLRDTGVPIGLLVNGTQFRLIYAPRGESAGRLTFTVNDMTEVAGRPMLAGLDLLLNCERLFAAPTEQRLPALLQRSRDYQTAVSVTLAGQVLDALYELLRGFQAANERTGGELLGGLLKGHPDEIYAGLVGVLLRLVFLLYAEDRGLLPATALYDQNYSVHGLYKRLAEDSEWYPDTMDQRYGGWAGLLPLFRSIHGGSRHPLMQMPSRGGNLFDPDRYPFLEGRTCAEPRIPQISDGVIFRVLHKLLILDGERLSYRTLDVEEIGSVYQTIMGFKLQIAEGPSIAITGKRKGKGSVPAPTVIELEELLQSKPADRAKLLLDRTGQKFDGKVADGLKAGSSIEDLLAALDRRIARNATPHLAHGGALVLQPTDERRRSGSHYTPRSLTEPIVRKTLQPVLERLGPRPKPAQILDLKVCDIAVGSGAFLVEACRQLGDELVRAWRHYGEMPVIPPDEDEILHARRTIAQSCLYGVDRNPMAVDLAKLSLWLATLAKDHPFTFIDHSLRAGDSLVGLTRQQLADFHWQPVKERVIGQQYIEKRIESATRYRRDILAAGDMVHPLLKKEKLEKADEALALVRSMGNLVIAALLAGESDRQRQTHRNDSLGGVTTCLNEGKLNAWPDEAEATLTGSPFSLAPFHWEIEYPEVFDRERPGFDAIIGNPPFLGGTRISSELGMWYFRLLTTMYPPAGHLCDLVAYFFRRAFSLSRDAGCLGLIATNTVSQGDTREGGLERILLNGGVIYDARRRYRWPGLAIVIVSVIHIRKKARIRESLLDGRPVDRISAFLLSGSVDSKPARLFSNPYFSLGSKIYGQGFLFDDGDPKASRLSVMRDILVRNPEARKRIFPYIGGEELNSTPAPAPVRFVIYLSDIQDEAELNQLPDLAAIVKEKVKPERDELGSNPNNIPLKQRWWAYQAHRPELYRIVGGMNRVIAISQVTAHLAFLYLPNNWIYSQKLCLIGLDTDAGLCSLQSRVHEMWARFLSSTLKDDLNYTPSDCFETYPFPKDFESNPNLEQVGKEYYEFRADLMMRNNEGLTKTYNRFHDPGETSPDIFRLRELHAAMDRAVLDAYGWTDLQPTCEFLLDYEEEEDSDEAPRKRKKPWRYRWPDEFRDEVLARLLALNAERAEEERLAGKDMEGKKTGKSPRKKSGKAKKDSGDSSEHQANLIEV
jgi:hypothetical protein